MAYGLSSCAGWNGKTWFFNGEAGATYNIISSRNYQVQCMSKALVYPMTALVACQKA